MEGSLRLEKKDIMREDSRLHFKVKGISMQPLLQDNDTVIVKHTMASEIIPGDIILYQGLFKDIVVHRVIKKSTKNEKTIFLIKGDNERGIGQYVCGEWVLGKVIFIERNGQRIEINNNPKRLKIIFYVKFSAFEIFIYSIFRNIRCCFRHRILGGLLRRLQSLKIYSCLVKRFISVDKIKYRTATINDATSLANFCRILYWPTELEIINEIFNTSLSNLGDNGYCLLAQTEDKVIGSMIIRRSFNQEKIFSGWWICNFFMSWCYRNTGIEEQLVKLAIEKVRKKGTREIKILVSKRDIFSVNFFKKLCENPVTSQFDRRLYIFTYHIVSI